MIAAVRATRHRGGGCLYSTMRMMCVSRHRAHLMGLVCLTDDSTHSGRDRRSGNDEGEDPREETSNHRIASIANFSTDGPEQSLNNVSEMPSASARLELHPSQPQRVSHD